jgi:hypothetical protein
LIEECAVIAAAEPEAGAWGLELFHVAGTIDQVAIHAVEDLHGRRALDGAQIGAASGDQMTAIRSGAGSPLTG